MQAVAVLLIMYSNEDTIISASTREVFDVKASIVE